VLIYRTSAVPSNFEDEVDLQDEEATSGDEAAQEDLEAFATDDLVTGEDEDDLLDGDIPDSEDEDMALNLANTETPAHGLPDLQVVQMRLASATRALGDWKAHGHKTGKSRSEVMEQLIDDIGNYYGYNKFLAEKLLDLFPVEEVGCDDI